jgi:transcriptional regulator with XRE-family HTH domain
MSQRQAFGPNLRRARIQKGISIEEIAVATNVNASLWEGLENNDLSRWPTGIYARSYIRSYAKAIGVDAEATVDEFCRCFPHGDRRAELVIRGHADIIGHRDLQWRDHIPSTVVEGDRRAGAAESRPPAKTAASPATAFSHMFGRLRALLRA